MKTCAKCKRDEVHEELLICKGCKSPFYDRSDQKMVSPLLAIYGIFYFLFKDHVSVPFLVMLGYLSWYLFYPALKLFQKWRNPRRSVFKEFWYGLPYSWIGLSAFFYSGLGLSVVPESELLSGQLNVGFEPGELYFELVSVGCYSFAFLYLGIILLSTRGIIFKFDRHYARIISKEYERLTDFKVLAKCDGDKCRIYFDKVAFDVDRQTFDLVYRTPGCLYFMDRDKIIYCDGYTGRILPEADISSFVFITQEDDECYCAFAKDDHSVYYLHRDLSKVIDGLSPESSLVVKDRYITDGKTIYQCADRIELDLDPETFEVLPRNYVRDRNGIYLISGIKQMKLDVVDPESFEAIDYETFKDKSGIYRIEGTQVRRMEADEILSEIGYGFIDQTDSGYIVRESD